MSIRDILDSGVVLYDDNVRVESIDEYGEFIDSLDFYDDSIRDWEIKYMYSKNDFLVIEVLCPDPEKYDWI